MCTAYACLRSHRIGAVQPVLHQCTRRPLPPPTLARVGPPDRWPKVFYHNGWRARLGQGFVAGFVCWRGGWEAHAGWTTRDIAYTEALWQSAAGHSQL
eukprot:358957-Chlamydomonas_euryale.AAC.3